MARLERPSVSEADLKASRLEQKLYGDCTVDTLIRSETVSDPVSEKHAGLVSEMASRLQSQDPERTNNVSKLA